MSASLVGSEMCIRDSVCPNPDLPQPHRPDHAYWSTASGRTRPAGTAGAVSYTHLTLPTICSV
eukprot:14681430-Alexandrium_andersonii.AAC.1